MATVGGEENTEGDLIVPGPSPSPVPQGDLIVPGPSPSPAPAPRCPSIRDVLTSLRDVDLLNGLAEFAGMDDALGIIPSSEQYTIFAPTNQAIESSGIDWEALISSNPGLVKLILNNHVIPGSSLQVEDFAIGETYLTWNEGKLLKLDAPLQPIVVESVTICGTVIHTVSAVIVPTFIDSIPQQASAGNPSASAAVGTPSSSASAGSSASASSSGSSVDIKDVSVGDSSFQSGSWNFGGFSGSVQNVNIG